MTENTSIQELFRQFVVPSYGRFDLAFTHGQGTSIYDVHGRRYLDFAAGIAVCCLGHAHPELTEALVEQARKMMHISNLYYHAPQGQLAQELVGLLAPGKMFFANSGAEANEGLYKLARKFGHEEGRFEILTAVNSFHGRTLAGISATGQDKVKKGFEPMVPGFRHVPYNDLQAMRESLSPATVAILIEGVQGEGGVSPASPEYLLGLRALCDEKKLLLLMDSVQCGHFRTGRFQSFQRILEGVTGATGFLPDGISMAKSLGGGFPIGAFWARQPYGDLLGPGTHATTYGGSPLACAIALKVLEIIRRDNLEANARNMGDYLHAGLEKLRLKYPHLIQSHRGLGLMVGIEMAAEIPSLKKEDKPISIQVVNRLNAAGLLTVPAGTQVIRLLPPLNLKQAEADEALGLFESVLKSL